MKIFKSTVAFCMAFWVLIGVLCVPTTVSAGKDKGDYGSITSCVYDTDLFQMRITGTVNYKVLVSSEEAELAVYRILPWEDPEEVIATAEPLATAPMTIRFDFTVPCRTHTERSSMYAVVLVSPDGTKTMLTEPRYQDAASAVGNTIGFKGVCTDNHASSVESGTGSAIVDVYLDKLENGKRSGYFYSIDGNIFYFDKEYIDSLDTIIRSYYACGTDVLLRFLISPDGKKLACAPDYADLSLYRGVVIDGAEALTQVYAYTHFLCSRYSSADFGTLSGIILGRGADYPEIYNYCAVNDDEYADLYSRSLTVIGLASGEAAGRGKVALIIPVTDSLVLSPEGEYKCHFEDFLDRVCHRLSRNTALSVIVMCESTHNPYGIYDDYFNNTENPSDPVDPEQSDDTDVSVEPEDENSDNEDTVNEDTAEKNPDDKDSDDKTPDDKDTNDKDLGDTDSDDKDSDHKDPDDITDPDGGAVDTREPLAPNDNESGFYCTDNFTLFYDCFTVLCSRYKALHDSYIWCWYPDKDTNSAALSVGYAYNYLAVAARDAVAFIVSFEDSSSDSFDKISHLFKYISTNESYNETAYARSVFGIEDWSEIIKGYDRSTGVYESFTEWQLKDSFSGIVGSMDMWNFMEQNGNQDWYRGFYCESLKSVTSEDGKKLRARMKSSDQPGAYADIGRICSPAEPLLFCNGLSFDFSVGESGGDLFEVRIKIYGNNMKIDSSAVVNSGKRTTLYLDTTDFPENTRIVAVRICARRLSGKGDYDLDLYRISLNSVKYDSDTLLNMISAARENIRDDGKQDDDQYAAKWVAACVLISVAVLTAVIALASDPKRKKR